MVTNYEKFVANINRYANYMSLICLGVKTVSGLVQLIKSNPKHKPMRHRLNDFELFQLFSFGLGVLNYNQDFINQQWLSGVVKTTKAPKIFGVLDFATVCRKFEKLDLIHTVVSENTINSNHVAQLASQFLGKKVKCTNTNIYKTLLKLPENAIYSLV